MSATTWIQQLADRPVTSPEAELERGHGGSLGPCPCCAATRRGHEDRRGPLGTTPDGRGWRCWAEGCGAEGDFADLMSYRIFNRRVRDLGAEQLRELREEAARRGLVADADPHGMMSPGTAFAASAGPTGAVSALLAGVVAENPTSPDDAEITFASQGHAPSPFRWRDGLPAGARDALHNDPDAAPVLEYLRRGRGLSDRVIEHYGLGALLLRRGGRVVERWLAIPLPHQDPVNVKFRRVPGPCLYCSPDGLADGPGCAECATKKVPGGTGRVPQHPKYRVCGGRPMPLYGTLSDPTQPAIVVGGELDVVALDDLGWRVNVVSGTTGEKAGWPDAWLDRLEPHPAILVGLDTDAAGDEGATALAEKLGRHKCSRVRWPAPHKDAGACLLAQVPVIDVLGALEAGESMTQLTITGPTSFAQQIEDLIKNPMRLRGLQCGVPGINEALGGLLPGLYVFTGESGHGKTSVVTWLAWDLARLGTPCLLTSFEQTPIGTVQKLLRMEIGGDFSLPHVTEADRLAALHLMQARGVWIVNRYGDVTYEQIREAARYARRRRGCRVVMIDHLDYIVRNRARGEDEREAKERVVRDLAVLGTDEDIIFFLIVHPNNMANANGRKVQLADCKGASAIRQEARAGVVVERLDPTPARPFPAALLTFEKVRNEFGVPGSRRLLAFDNLSSHLAAKWEDTPSGRAGHRVVVP